MSKQLDQRQPEVKYKCTLLKEVNQCPFYINEGSLCTKADDKSDQSMSNCAFKQPLHEKNSLKDPYVREPRWYEELPSRQKKSKQSDNGKDPFPFT